MTQKIEFFWIWHKELNFFWMWFKVFFSKKKTLSIEHFENMTPRIEPDFGKYDSQNWTHLFHLTQRIETLLSKWLKELNPSVQHDSQYWTIFSTLNHRIWTWLKVLNHFSLKKYNSKNWTHFTIWLIELNPFPKCLNELDFFFEHTQRIELFWIWFKELNFFECDSNNWALF